MANEFVCSVIYLFSNTGIKDYLPHEDEDGDKKSVHPQGLTFVPGRGNLPYGAISWGIDEEERDGLDNDLDGQIDEDCYEFSYKLIGYLPIKSSGESTKNRLVMSYR